MLDYFFMLDKLYGEEKNVSGTNTLKKGMWYQYVEKEEEDGENKVLRKVLLVDVAGIEEKDLIVDFEEDRYNGYIIIKGKTTTEFGDFEIDQRFKIPVTYLSDKSFYSIKNGMLYITIIPQEKTKFQIKKLTN